MEQQENYNGPEERSTTMTWDVPSDKEEAQACIFHESLAKLLMPYQPANTEKEADYTFTTNELIQALEMHYAVPQGDADLAVISGTDLVNELYKFGYKAVNTGGLQLEWLMKKKIAS
jgi:hypothetical protein